MKKFIITITCIIVVLFGIYLLRYPILRSFGNHLVYADSLKRVDAIFVLSGQGYERGNEAAKLYKQGYAKKIVCTGGNKNPDFLAMNMDLYESAVTQNDLLRCGVDSAVIDTLNKGKSTDDESNVILNYCKKNNIHSCIIVSSKFHTRRIKYAFQKKFESNDITVLIHGAPSVTYNESVWWKNEYGAIALNNEYIKLLYYHLKGK
jgi:uncharacterized SAM-binding protein YcdF (DUF218 family)